MTAVAMDEEDHPGELRGRREEKRREVGPAATYLAAARTSGGRSGDGEGGGGAWRGVAAWGSWLCPCRPERSDPKHI
jgi:hypothetical protein